MKFLIILIIIAILAFILLVPVQQYIYMHELVHQKAYEINGVDSNVTIGFGYGYTQPVEGFETSQQFQSAKNFNMLNEIVGYNVSPLLIWTNIVLSVGFFVVCFYLIRINWFLMDIKKELKK